MKFRCLAKIGIFDQTSILENDVKRGKCVLRNFLYAIFEQRNTITN